LRDILTDDALAVDLRARGLANARRFTWTASAERHLKIFRRLISGTSGRSYAAPPIAGARHC
jgi:hypothetical protein